MEEGESQMAARAQADAHLQSLALTKRVIKPKPDLKTENTDFGVYPHTEPENHDFNHDRVLQ